MFIVSVGAAEEKLKFTEDHTESSRQKKSH